MATQFEGRSLVAGSVSGVRSWRIRKDGTLTGVVYQEPWGPRLNTAHCMIYTNVPGVEHRRAQAECTCGFYAYFHAKHNSYGRYAQTVNGIIEGVGLASVGNKGFRIEKARVVALVKPAGYLAITIALLWLAMIVRFAFYGGISWIDLVYVLPAYITARNLQWITLIRWRFSRTRRRYPDIPVYRTYREAVEAHPLTRLPGYVEPDSASLRTRLRRKLVKRSQP